MNNETQIKALEDKKKSAKTETIKEAIDKKIELLKKGIVEK